MDIEQNFQYPITHLRKFVHYLTIKELVNLRLVSREFNHCIENELYEFNFVDSIQPKDYGFINKFSNLQIIHLPKSFDGNFQLDYINPNSVNTLIYKYVHFNTTRAEEINSQFPNLRRLKYIQQKTCLNINENIQFYNQIVELSVDGIRLRFSDQQILFACPMLEKLSISIGNLNIIEQLVYNERSPKLKGLKLTIEQQDMDHQKLINLLDEYFQMLNTLQILQFNVKVSDRQIRLKYFKLICANKFITHLYLRKLFFDEYAKLQFNRRLQWIGINFNQDYSQLHQDAEAGDEEDEEVVDDNESEESPNNSQELHIEENPQVQQQVPQIELQNPNVSIKVKQQRETTETPEILDLSRNEFPDPQNDPKHKKIKYEAETVKKGWELVTIAIRPGAHTQLIFNNKSKSFIKYQSLEAQQYLDVKFLEPFAKKFL
ncbi:hypothetical protein pb186bvf_001254 [Paramecium bursaria]